MRMSAVIAAVGVMGLAMGTAAATTRTVTGTLTSLLVETNLTVAPGTVSFRLSVAPAATGCTLNNGIFAYSISSVSDADSRHGMLAVLLEAHAMGTPVIVVYDDAGAYCDPLGYAVPIAVGPASS